MEMTNYSFLYKLSKRIPNKKNTNRFQYLPTNIIEQIQDYLYSQKEHFNAHVRPLIWNQSWLFWNRYNSDEEQFVFDYIFKMWGIVTTNEEYLIPSDKASMILRKTRFCDRYCSPKSDQSSCV
jgi:hypothetical protein